MAPVYIKKAIFLWIDCVLSLIANLAIMLALYFMNSPYSNNFLQTLFVSLFILVTVYYRTIGSGSTFFCFFLFTIIINLIPDSYKKNEQRDLSENEQENDTVENNEDNQIEEVEANQNTQEKEGSGGQNQSFFDRLKSIDVITAIFVLMEWISCIDRGINNFNDLRYKDFAEYYTDGTKFIYVNGEKKVLINYLFYHVFTYATYQFIIGMFVLKDDPPKWLYLFYMIPQAIFYPISSIFAYYIADENDTSFFSNIPYGPILSVYYIYYTFTMVPQFIQRCKGEGEIKGKMFPLIFLAVAYLWLVFIRGIRTMNI